MTRSRSRGVTNKLATQFEPSDVIGKSREAHFRENYRPIGRSGEGGWEAHFAAIARREPFRDLGIQIIRPSGEHRVFLSNGGPIHDEAGNFLGCRGSTVDVTERHALEERLRLAQKMEAVGQLTGGIAHEFNNLLQVVAGNIDRLEGLVPPAEMTGRRFQTVRRNVTRGAELTSRLLSFPRRQPLAPKAVEIAIVLAKMQGMLGQTLGETIEVRVDPTGDVWAAAADAKAGEVIAKLKGLRLGKTAELVTDNIAGTKWSSRRYMNMDLLKQVDTEASPVTA